MEDVTHSVVRKLIALGEIKAIINHLLEMDVFEDVSKHNPYFDSEHEIEDEKLTSLRFKLSYIQDKLHEIHATMFD
jgi:hypothetical protein